MIKTILAAVLTFGIAGAALAEGEGVATTGDWREIKTQPASQMTDQTAPITLSGSFEFNDGATAG